MKNTVAAVCELLMALAIFCGPAHADVGFALIGEGMPTDISADGSVIVGNTNGWEAFRWTKHDGMVRLGNKGPIAGTPDVSDDGTKVSATISSDDGTYYTWGLWTLGLGWQELMPPAPHPARSRGFSAQRRSSWSDSRAPSLFALWRPI